MTPPAAASPLAVLPRELSGDAVIARRTSELVGSTPLLELVRTGSGTRLLLKLEQLNPTGSCKVRMARQMVLEAEADGRLRPGGRIVEPTSGNTGLGLALVALERGYRFTAIVDRHAAKDKLRAMEAMGAELVVVEADPTAGPSSIERRRVAAQIAAETGAFHPDQHNNPGNANGYGDLADELIDQLGTFDVLVAALGTGGSLCGTVRGLRSRGVMAQSVAVEPRGSIVFGGEPGVYHQTGAGSPAGFPIGCNVDRDVIDIDHRVGDGDAFATARVVARRTGLLLGGTTGGAIHVALRHLVLWPAGSTVVVLCNDAGEKYLDSVYDDDWLAARGVLDEPAHRRVRRWLNAYDESVRVADDDRASRRSEMGGLTA
ncbi:cysteine synthase family protein [Tsukamurella sp. 8F]|uniref:PLP-dependent cysteine synthase family protein n=1 Tax=unclassified Tsukamurella TaxID=2633480 RepID=UPI0023B8CC7A|nr:MULTISPECIES: cysteine synthase family protein [unclassified Tsukamurella]MDF0531936.1 cysteine synthase family protein [Tsukamurella sp. 8J]MDF0588013.1 cysteine synthase family protein [Tsukamurella sp. 8F]